MPAASPLPAVQIRDSPGRRRGRQAHSDITERYQALTTPAAGIKTGVSNRSIRQRLSVSGAHDFDDPTAYRAFISAVARRIRRNAQRIAAEQAALAALYRRPACHHLAGLQAAGDCAIIEGMKTQP